LVFDFGLINRLYGFAVRISLQLVHARRDRLSNLLRSDRYLSIAAICSYPAISEAAALRELTALSQPLEKFTIWNSQAGIVHSQRAVLNRTSRLIFCLDSTKIGHQAACQLAEWSEVPQIIINAIVEQFRAARFPLPTHQILTTP